MTLEELLTELERRRALGLEYIAMRVAGERRGARARVIPGVMGRVIGPTHDGKGTIVDVRCADVERALERGNTVELEKWRHRRGAKVPR